MSELTVTIKKPARKIFLFTPQHEEIIREGPYKYHLLTAKQITRLIRPTPQLGNLKRTQERLKELEDNKYLITRYLPTETGSRPKIYALGIKGRRHIEAQGLEVVKYYEPGELKALTLTLEHTLELNDFIILAETLYHYEPRISLTDLEHSLIFELTPLEYLDAETGKPRVIKPDALFKLHVKREGKEEKHYFCWTELDRGTVKDEPMKKKLRAIYDYIKRGYFERHYGTGGAVRIFIVTTQGEARVDHLRSLFRQEFPGLNPKRGQNQLFKFGSIPPLMEKKPLPLTVLCQPYWKTAYGDPDELQTIIDLTD